MMQMPSTASTLRQIGKRHVMITRPTTAAIATIAANAPVIKCSMQTTAGWVVADIALANRGAVA